VQIDPQVIADNARLAEHVFMAIPDPYRPVSGRLVHRTHFGVLNIPDFLAADGERDYYLNLPNVHAATVVKALELAGVDLGVIDHDVIDAAVGQLRALIHHRSRNARRTHASIQAAIEVLDASARVSVTEIVEVVRGLARSAA
jgi:2-isopropylmalate synthase